jgi:crotonobetainyl-CoA:carnitine CoA-transferase CaiB-like acyl-CoA transferase
MQAAVSVLAAVVARQNTGRGAAIEVSMFDTTVDLLAFELLHTRYTGAGRAPIGMSSPVVTPYGAYPTKDGRTVVLGTTNDAEWRRLAVELLGRADLAEDETLATNARRCRQRARLDAAIAEWTAHDLAEVCARTGSVPGRPCHVTAPGVRQPRLDDAARCGAGCG